MLVMYCTSVLNLEKRHKILNKKMCKIKYLKL